jgi:cell division protein FtsN
MKKEGYPDAFIVAFKNNERLAGSIQSISKSQEQTGQQPTTKPVQPPVEKAAISADAIVYRVQFAATSKPKGSYEMTIGGKKYRTFEYLYNGAYRSCVGEFSSSASAASLQKQLKQEGYSDAFIIPTKGKDRVTDPALLKK